MPVYNSAAYLSQAIDSILNQTFTDFELIILNDGSTDNSKDIILSYSDSRIVFIDGPKIGLPRIQNKGIEQARGKYIARMDSDDIALPERLESQFNFMESHPDIAVCGTFFEFTGGNGLLGDFNWVTQTEPELVKINLLFDCAICQPTAMLRVNILKENNICYNEFFQVSEDYELWVAIAKRFKIANLPLVLLHYRVSATQVSGRKNELQVSNKITLIKAQLYELGIEPNDVELRMHNYFFFSAVILSYDYLPKVKKWIEKLVNANNINSVYDKALFAQYLDELLHSNTKSFNRALRDLSLKQKTAYLIKRLLRWESIR